MPTLRTRHGHTVRRRRAWQLLVLAAAFSGVLLVHASGAPAQRRERHTSPGQAVSEAEPGRQPPVHGAIHLAPDPGDPVLRRVTTALSNGESETLTWAAAGGSALYLLDVPASYDEEDQFDRLTFLLSGITGEANLYTKQGTKATSTNNDCASEAAGTGDKICTYAYPAIGRYYVNVTGVSASGSAAIAGMYTRTLRDGWALTYTVGSEKLCYFTFEVPEGTDGFAVQVQINDGTVDLYAKHEAVPTTDASPCLLVPFSTHHARLCTDNPAKAGTYYVLAALSADVVYLNVAAWTTTELKNGVEIAGLSGGPGDMHFFTFTLGAGFDSLSFVLTGDSDASLRVWLNGYPDARSFCTHFPVLKCKVPTIPGTYYAEVQSYSNFSGVGIAALASYELTEGVARGSLSGRVGTNVYFTFEAPASAGGVVFALSGGGGNADVYALHGGVPTTSINDCSSTGASNDEACFVSTAEAGTYTVLVDVVAAYSGASLVAETTGELENGVEAAVLSGTSGAKRYYTFEADSGYDSLLFVLSGAGGNASVYAKLDGLPTSGSNRCGYVDGGARENCTISSPGAGTYYVLVEGTGVFSDVGLVTVHTSTLTLGDPTSTFGGDSGSMRYFAVSVPGGQGAITISLSGGAGNADVFASLDAVPTTDSHDCASTGPGSDKACSIGSTGNATCYVLVAGTAAYSDASLTAKFEPVSDDSSGPGARAVVLIAICGAVGAAIVGGGGVAAVFLAGRAGDTEQRDSAGAKLTSQIDADHSADVAQGSTADDQGSVVAAETSSAGWPRAEQDDA